MKKLFQVVIVLLTLQSVSFAQTPTIQTIINETNIDSLTYFVRRIIR